MEFQTGQLLFASASGSGPRELRMRHAFEPRIGQASVVLTGFTASFDNDDHNFGRFTVELAHRVVNESTTGHEVEVVARLGLRDFSGNWDDAYSGKVEYCVIVVPASRRPPIGPLDL
jgi:hypothetical protein